MCSFYRLRIPGSFFMLFAWNCSYFRDETNSWTLPCLPVTFSYMSGRQRTWNLIPCIIVFFFFFKSSAALWKLYHTSFNDRWKDVRDDSLASPRAKILLPLWASTWRKGLIRWKFYDLRGQMCLHAKFVRLLSFAVIWTASIREQKRCNVVPIGRGCEHDEIL